MMLKIIVVAVAFLLLLSIYIEDKTKKSYMALSAPVSGYYQVGGKKYYIKAGDEIKITPRFKF